MKLRVVSQAEGKSRDAQHPNFVVEDTQIASEAKTLDDIRIVLFANPRLQPLSGLPSSWPTGLLMAGSSLSALPEVYMTGSGYVSNYI